jgi:hypothetical protein
MALGSKPWGDWVTTVMLLAPAADTIEICLSRSATFKLHGWFTGEEYLSIACVDVEETDSRFICPGASSGKSANPTTTWTMVIVCGSASSAKRVKNDALRADVVMCELCIGSGSFCYELSEESPSYFRNFLLRSKTICAVIRVRIVAEHVVEEASVRKRIGIGFGLGSDPKRGLLRAIVFWPLSSRELKRTLRKGPLGAPQSQVDVYWSRFTSTALH